MYVHPMLSLRELMNCVQTATNFSSSFLIFSFVLSVPLHSIVVLSCSVDILGEVGTIFTFKTARQAETAEIL